MSRNDIASVTFNFVLPPEVIKEYFEGMAKVEAAKHPPESSKSFDLTSLLGLAPMLLPFLSNLTKESETNSKTTIPESVPKETVKSINTDGSKPDIVISFVQKSVDEKDSKNECSTSETCDSVQIKKESPKEMEKTDETVESDSTERKVEMTHSSGVTGCTLKRPVYQEGDTVVLDFKKLGAALAGSGSMNDMMKLISPVMDNIIEGMNTGGQNPFDTMKLSKSEEFTEPDATEKKDPEKDQ